MWIDYVQRVLEVKAFRAHVEYKYVFQQFESLQVQCQ